MSEIDQELLSLFCDESLDCLSRWESVCVELSKNPENNDLMQELFRLAHNLKGGSKAVGLNDYGDFVHKVEDGITLVRDRKVEASDLIQTLFLEAQKILTDWSNGLKNDPTFAVPNWVEYVEKYQKAFQGGTVSTFEAETAKIENVIDPVQGRFNSESKQAPHPELLAVQIHSVEQSNPKKENQSKVGKGTSNQNETIRISAQKLDHLIQTIGELSIHQSIVWHTKSDNNAANRVFTNSMQLSQKLTKELYDSALSLRMQPLASVFQRLERTIIELSKTLEKSLKVHVSGGDVELDKTVIEKIVDPLMHIVRNAVDHGIENPADRIINSKSEEGSISISAQQDTFGVIIKIQDDGKGLSTERILKKAVEKKLIDANQVKSKEDVFSLIFLPGFSTSEKITDVSGRGVGMNVVSSALEELQGQIKIESEEEKGTTFIITLPTSVSIIEAMLVSLSGQNYVIPVGSIEEVISLNDVNFEKGQKMLHLREQVVPIHDLNHVLVTKKNTVEVSSSHRSLLVTRSGSDRVGFLVDKVIGQQQIVIRPLNEMIDGAYGIMGGTILGNGEPGLIVDVPRVALDFIKKNKPKEVAA